MRTFLAAPLASLLALACAGPSAGPEPPAPPPVLQPNLHDTDGAPAFVHFLPEHGPILVRVPVPERTPGALLSPDRAQRIVVAGARVWQNTLVGVAPWLELSFAAEAQAPDIEVRWVRRRDLREPEARVGFRVLDGQLRPHVALEAGYDYKGPKADWLLYRAAIRSFGLALGVADPQREPRELPSALSGELDERRPKFLMPAAWDVDSFCATLGQPSGFREDGQPLQAAVAQGWSPPPPAEAVAACQAPAAGHRPMACLQHPPAHRYLRRLRERVMGQWAPPEGVAPDQRVEVRFVLGQDGELLANSVVEATDPVLAGTVVQAMERAAPFGEIPLEAACMVHVPLEATFRNPEVER